MRIQANPAVADKDNDEGPFGAQAALEGGWWVLSAEVAGVGTLVLYEKSFRGGRVQYVGWSGVATGYDANRLTPAQIAAKLAGIDEPCQPTRDLGVIQYALNRLYAAKALLP